MNTTDTFNPSRLTVKELVAMLRGASAHYKAVTIEAVEGDIESGAPTNDDGTINLMDYTAWLIAENRNLGD